MLYWAWFEIYRFFLFYIYQFSNLGAPQIFRFLGEFAPVKHGTYELFLFRQPGRFCWTLVFSALMVSLKGWQVTHFLYQVTFFGWVWMLSGADVTLTYDVPLRSCVGIKFNCLCDPSPFSTHRLQQGLCLFCISLPPSFIPSCLRSYEFVKTWGQTSARTRISSFSCTQAHLPWALCFGVLSLEMILSVSASFPSLLFLFLLLKRREQRWRGEIPLSVLQLLPVSCFILP